MVKFKNVTKKFGQTTALEDVTFELDPGEFVFVIGPSGAGKTTLAKLILKNFLPSEGVIEVGGVDLRKIPRGKIPEYRRRLGMVFQDFRLIPDLTVFENVALALRILRRKEAEIIPRVTEVLNLVSLENRADFFPAQLAGGELQRTCLARAVVGEPEIVIADEPTGNLDLRTARQIVDLLKKISQEMGKTVIMATHNFEVVNLMKERVIELEKGRVVSDQKKGRYHLSSK